MLVEGKYADFQGVVVSRANQTGKYFWVVVSGLKQEKSFPRTRFSQIILNWWIWIRRHSLYPTRKITIFCLLWTSCIASTPDWVTEFAEKQARQEQEDKIKVPVFGKYCWTNKFVTYCFVCLIASSCIYLTLMFSNPIDSEINHVKLWFFIRNYQSY